MRLLRRGELRDYLLIGAAIGLAVASKYTAALVAVSPLVATLLARRPIASSLRNLVALGLAALVFCFVATPFSFLHFSQFRAAMAYEYEHVHSLHYGFSLPAVGWQYHKYVYELFAGFPFSLGFALYASAVAGSAWVLLGLRREHVVVLAFAVPFFAILGHWTFTPLRYMLPVVVLGAAVAGLWQGSWIESGPGWRRTIGATVAAVVLAYTTLFTVSTTARLRHDTRIEAAHWLDETLKPGERLLLCGYSPYMAVPTDPRIVVNAVNEVWISKLATRTDFDLVEITSMHFLAPRASPSPGLRPRVPSLPYGRARPSLGEGLRRRLPESRSLPPARPDVRRLLHLADGRVLRADRERSVSPDDGAFESSAVTTNLDGSILAIASRGGGADVTPSSWRLSRRPSAARRQRPCG